jgi:prefoldin subunit 5
VSSTNYKLTKVIRELEHIRQTLEMPSRLNFSSYHVGMINGLNLAMAMLSGKKYKIHEESNYYAYESLHNRLQELERENIKLKDKLKRKEQETSTVNKYISEPARHNTITQTYY